MKADYLSYARATSVSLFGLVIQLAMGVGLLIYSILAKDHAAQSGAYAVLLGAAVWIVLAIVYDQHRRERVEALEQEQLDAQQGSSVFSAATNDELRVAARRLAWMHRFLVPGVSVLLAALLIGLAYWRIMDALPRIGYDKGGVDQFIKPTARGWAIALGLGIAIIGFIFARFVSGMAKQKVWANLRGGAAYAVLASLFGVAIAIGQFVDLANRDDVLRYLQLIIPGVAGFLGIEIVVSLLLNLYRPRKQGEIPRAAFDSPVLGFVASPDKIAQSIGGAISYQVGIDVTGTWAYQLVARAVLPLVLMGAGVIWVMTCVAVVGTSEQGIRVRNGKALERVGPGLYFKLPWPFETIDRTQTSTLQTVELATPAAGNEVRALLWTNDHKVKESYAVVRASRREAGAPDASEGSFELSLVAVRVPLKYRVSDLDLWERFASPATREELLKVLAQREVMLELAQRTDDEVIGRDRGDASAAILKRVQASFNSAKTGVEVLFAGIESVHPQREVAREFEKIVQAGQAREEIIERGKTEAIGTLTRVVGDLELARTIAQELQTRKQMQDRKAAEAEIAAQTVKIESLILKAGGRAGALLAQARSDRWGKHMSQRGQALAYAGRLAAYRANPQLYKATLYLGMIRDETVDARVYLVPDSELVRVRINAEDAGSGGNIFTSGAADSVPK